MSTSSQSLQEADSIHEFFNLVATETFPNQSTFWRAWNERFSEELRNAVPECADSIVTAVRVCDVSLPDRIGTDEPDELGSDDVRNASSSPRKPTRSGSRPNRS